MNKAENETKPEEVKPVSITIEFAEPDENGEVSTHVAANGMTIQHFRHLEALARWYIKEEFPQEEQDNLKNYTEDTIEEK